MKLFKACFFSMAVAVATFTATVYSSPVKAQRPDVIIGWTTWEDAEVVTKLAAVILRRGMSQDVELTLADISVQYRGVAEGNLDAMLMSWQPLTHKAYMQKYGDDLVDLGAIYKGANLGLAVPAYVPESEVASIADLAKPSVREKFGGQIQGIDENAGITGMARKAMKHYGVDYDLLPGTGPKMAMEVGKAFRNDRWIVATGWRPHWKFAKFDLRYLDDPKGVFGAEESVHAVVNQSFVDRKPELAAFFKRMDLEVAEVEALMAAAEDTSHREAIYQWIKKNPERVNYWISGQ
ncbi:glycine betaine ABC transporter substrate-binding protein [Marinobacter sp. HN1S83]|uniref:glycine betaine ABC transporter substrate-binding protein n=1 Tax=Marinobacter sp. HN1S83 TaxID=3382301 RepID=UPI00387B7BB2